MTCWDCRPTSPPERKRCARGRCARARRRRRPRASSIRISSAASSVRGEELQLLLRLDAFGDDLEPELAAHRDDGRADRGVIRVPPEIRHERAVDLERLDREMLEVRERGVAGAEIVDRDVYTEL